jgi:hypothetical protein
MGVTERDTLKSDEGRKLYDDLMTRMPDRDEKGRITGWGTPPEADLQKDVKDQEAAQFYERLDAHRDKDPQFRQLDDKIRSAEIAGRLARVKDVESARYTEMEKEGTWGDPGSDTFREELGRRVSTLEVPESEDRYGMLKHQEHILVRNKVDQEQLDTWLKVRDKIRRGETVEPLEPFEKSSATFNTESPFGKWDPEDQ